MWICTARLPVKHGPDRTYYIHFKRKFNQICSWMRFLSILPAPQQCQLLLISRTLMVFCMHFQSCYAYQMKKRKRRVKCISKVLPYAWRPLCCGICRFFFFARLLCVYCWYICICRRFTASNCFSFRKILYFLLFSYFFFVYSYFVCRFCLPKPLIIQHTSARASHAAGQ